jgi:hypothetical protein
MKKVSLFLTLALFVFAASANEVEKEKQAIQQVIQSAYIDGIHNLGDVEDIRDGFHPGFNLLGVNGNDQLTKFPIYSWIESVEKRKAQNPDGRAEEEKITCKYNQIDVTGKAAQAEIELYRKGEKIFTDYLQLYKFEEGWRIVSKIYHRH